jgi:hypothetical protein
MMKFENCRRLQRLYQTQPGDNIAPSKPTEVLIGYDSKQLYFGFHAFDDPTKVRATLAKRDHVFGEDNVRVFWTRSTTDAAPTCSPSIRSAYSRTGL